MPSQTRDGNTTARDTKWDTEMCALYCGDGNGKRHGGLVMGREGGYGVGVEVRMVEE